MFFIYYYVVNNIFLTTKLIQVEYLGKISNVPARMYSNIKTSRRFYEPLYFKFEDEESFNAFYFKTSKMMSDSSNDKNNGRCIVEDAEKCKHIVDVEQINLSHQMLTAEIFICGIKKIK